MPRTVSRRARDEDAPVEPPRSRRSRYDDDEDEAPRSRSRSREDSIRSETSRSEDAKSTAIGRGRDGLRRHQETHKASGFPDRFKVDDDKVIVKLLDDDFFVTYYQHWLNDSPVKQKSFVCLGDDCPLCAIGDRPSFYALINVLDLSNPRKPEVKVWYASADPAEQIAVKLEDLEDRDKTATDSDVYMVVSKKKQKNNFFAYTVELVKARDLDEDYGITPLDARELSDYADEKFDEEIIRITPRKELRQIAEDLDDE